MIEQTEALVSIDVNGGHCMLGHGTSQEKAILDVNLAAAKQVLKTNDLYFLFLFELLLMFHNAEESVSQYIFLF